MQVPSQVGGAFPRQSTGSPSGAAHVALEVHSGACAGDREAASGQLPRGSRGHSQQLQKHSSPQPHQQQQQQSGHKDPDSGLHRRSRAKDPVALPDPQQQHGEAGAGAGAGAKPGAPPPPIKVPMRRLLSYNKPEWPYGVVGVAASAAAGVVRPAFAFVMSSIITVFYGRWVSKSPWRQYGIHVLDLGKEPFAQYYWFAYRVLTPSVPASGLLTHRLITQFAAV